LYLMSPVLQAVTLQWNKFTFHTS